MGIVAWLKIQANINRVKFLKYVVLIKFTSKLSFKHLIFFGGGVTFFLEDPDSSEVVDLTGKNY